MLDAEFLNYLKYPATRITIVNIMNISDYDICLMEKEYIIENKWIKFVPIIFIIVIILIGIFNGQQNAYESSKNLDFYNTVIIGDITVHEVLLLLLLGFVSGTVGGLLGMGGGVLKIANLHLIMGFEILLARIVSLISYFVVSISAFLMYRKYNLILWNVVKTLIPSSILGAIIGVIIGNYINKEHIEIILGVYALFTGIMVINQIWVRPSEKEISEIPDKDIKEKATCGIGIGMGIISSIIGISGGILSTPMQQTILKLPLKNSIANTITTAIFCSITASGLIIISSLNKGDFSIYDALIVTICLIPGNFIGGQFGSFLTKRLHLNFVRVIFALVAFLIGFKILT